MDCRYNHAPAWYATLVIMIVSYSFGFSIISNMVAASVIMLAILVIIADCLVVEQLWIKARKNRS